MHTFLFQTSTTTTQAAIKLNHAGALAFNLNPSNGSLSDSGISDGGGSSDYNLSDRERRLGALRRLVKQLEKDLAPGSSALGSIKQRLESLEGDLQSVRETCRELIVRTAANQPSPTMPETNAIVVPPQPINFQIPIINIKAKPQKRPTQK